jgi:putative aldouronate transport system substrate-binding protein
MKRIKKGLAAALTAAAALSLLTGCGSTDTGSKTEQTTEAAKTTADTGNGETTAAAEVAKPEKITWMVHSGMNEENGTAQWAEEFQRLTGIKMDLQIISNNEYKQILELSFASDTVPDVFDLTGENLAVYAKQNAIADVTDLVKNSEFYKKGDKAMWDSVTLDGRIYGIPLELPGGTVTYVRKDWLDKLGMEEPKTYDEFIEMLRRFKEEIPECKVPLTATGFKNNVNAQFLPEFYQGATPEFAKIDGVWVDGMSQDNMVKALTNLHEAYAEGLIDTELVTNTTSNCRDQWYSGSVGAFNYWSGMWGNTLLERLNQNVPEAEIVALKPIEGAVYQARTPSMLCINARITQEEIDSIFKYMIEYMHDGGEGQVLFESGVEGLHWEQDGDKLKQLPTLSNPNEVLQKAWVTPWLRISPLELTDKNIDLKPMVVSSLAVDNEYSVTKSVVPVSATLTKIQSDLTALKEEILAKVVMGDLTVEEGLTKYKTESEMLNVQKAVDEMNDR